MARDAVVLVPTGSDFDRLTDSLRRSGALRNVRKFVRIARIRGLDETVRPGRYKLDAGMTYAALIDRLKQGLQAPVRVTFNNVRTLDRLAGSVGRAAGNRFGDACAGAAERFYGPRIRIRAADLHRDVHSEYLRNVLEQFGG